MVEAPEFQQGTEKEILGFLGLGDLLKEVDVERARSLYGSFVRSDISFPKAVVDARDRGEITQKEADDLLRIRLWQGLKVIVSAAENLPPPK